MRLDSYFFEFDERSSQEFNLVQTPNAKGLYAEVLVGDKNIQEDKIQGRDEPYFYNTQREVLSFELKFSVYEGTLTSEQLKEIQKWLFQDNYKPLRFDGNADVVYYVIMDKNPNFAHNGLSQGTFTVRARCNAPYGYTPLEVTPIASLTDNLGGTTIPYTNDGTIEVRPNIFIDKTVEDGSVLFENLDNGSKFEITITNGESLEIDGKNKIVKNVTSGDLESATQYWLSFRPGVNDIRITGNMDVYFTYSAPLYMN